MARVLFVVASVCLLLVGQAYGDCYLQYPPGSNDRLNEANADRNDANRLFRSENNARGGYCWSPDSQLQFYVGSVLPVQWTAQHGCNSANVECNFVIQYMCTDNSGAAATQLRDGTTTNQINANNYQQTDNGKLQFGMHEPLAYFQDCTARERNKGLFTADQNLNGNTAQFTRQSPNGATYGFECDEEENYYPYWHPTPWRDVAVLSATAERCAYYQAQSQNVLAKNYCKLTTTNNNQQVPNQEQACSAAGGQWLSQPAFGIAAPDCQVANYSRDNHLGNGVEGETAAYNWTIPADPCTTSATGCSCALRIRYNISTSNTDNWGFIDSRFNGDNSPVQQNSVSDVEGGELTLALNTNQYGRTFQDRSHSFAILPRPAGIAADTKIYNLGVRGKRGNIVQTFPATEYDYVPTNLAVTQDDLVHYQWTGCDTNPQGNAGEGTDQTDRSNIVQVDSRLGNMPLSNSTQMAAQGITPMFDNDQLRSHMAFIGQTDCLTQAELLKKDGNNQNTVNQDTENCAKLNKAPTPYFNAGLVKMNNTGTFQYMSTRNNNFSNRSQKGTLIVTPGAAKPTAALSPGQSAGIAVGVVAAVGLAAGAVAFVVYGKKNPHSFAGQTMSNLRNIGGGSNHGYSASSGRKEALLS